MGPKPYKNQEFPYNSLIFAFWQRRASNMSFFKKTYILLFRGIVPCWMQVDAVGPQAFAALQVQGEITEMIMI